MSIMSRFDRIGRVLKDLDLDGELLSLVQTNRFMDAMFTLNVSETYSELETAIRKANVEILPQLWNGLKRAIFSEFPNLSMPDGIPRVPSPPRADLTTEDQRRLQRLNRCNGASIQDMGGLITDVDG